MRGARRRNSSPSRRVRLATECDGGDSGSLIVGADRRAVALLFAGSDQGGANGQGLAYANPIQSVLDALSLELAL